MRSVIALTVLAAAAFFVAPQTNASATTWCSLDETVSCSFTSLQQCHEGANSTNAVCEPSNFPEDQQTTNPHVRRHAAKH